MQKVVCGAQIGLLVLGTTLLLSRLVLTLTCHQRSTHYHQRQKPPDELRSCLSRLPRKSFPWKNLLRNTLLFCPIGNDAFKAIFFSILFSNTDLDGDKFVVRTTAFLGLPQQGCSVHWATLQQTCLTEHKRSGNHSQEFIWSRLMVQFVTCDAIVQFLWSILLRRNYGARQDDQVSRYGWVRWKRIKDLSFKR